MSGQQFWFSPRFAAGITKLTSVITKKSPCHYFNSGILQFIQMIILEYISKEGPQFNVTFFLTQVL